MCATDSTFPGMMLHIGGNVFSAFSLFAQGRSEWQLGSSTPTLVRQSGVDAAFVANSALDDGWNPFLHSGQQAHITDRIEQGCSRQLVNDRAVQFYFVLPLSHQILFIPACCLLLAVRRMREGRQSVRPSPLLSRVLIFNCTRLPPAHCATSTAPPPGRRSSIRAAASKCCLTSNPLGSITA